MGASLSAARTAGEFRASISGSANQKCDWNFITVSFREFRPRSTRRWLGLLLLERRRRRRSRGSRIAQFRFLVLRLRNIALDLVLADLVDHQLHRLRPVV